MLDLQDIKKLYFIGIGGIGMSAIARYFLQRGVEVHGYDRTSTELTRALEAEGMHVHYEEDLSKVPAGVDLVVYTPAVPTSHAEYQHFLQNGTPIKKRAEVLGIISRGMKTVAIAGTHGKTTTSSLTAHLLRSTGVDCTAFLGGIARNFESNYMLGSSDWVVVEADEFDRSFLHLYPDIASIMSMDADHLDIYGDEETLLNTGFKAFAKQIKPGGTLWLQHRLQHHFDGNTAYRSFGVEGGDYQAHNIRVEKGYFVFDYTSPQGTIEGLRMPLPGRHNVENATVALSIALQLGAKEEDIRSGLAAFRGVKRRFEIIYRDEETAFFDDYAHHPTELNAAIGAARELFPSSKITGAFQPHLFSRTRDFADGFAEALDQLDEIYLLDIYPARELPIPGVSSDMLVKLMKNPNVHLISKADLLPALQNNKPEVLLTLGAGDIDTLVEPIGNWLNSSKNKTTCKMAESTNKNKITRQQLKALAWMATLLVGAMVVLSAVNHRKSAAVKGVEVEIKPLPNGDLLMQPVDVTELIHKAFGYEFQSRSVRTVEIDRLERVLEKDPLVQDAEVYLDARDMVRVTVTQREPVIRIIDKDGWNYYLDKNGIRMPLSKHFTARVVVATGSIPVYVPDFLEREKHLLRQLFLLSSELRKDAFLNAMIGQIFVSSNGDFILAPLIGDQKIVFGKYEDAKEKIQNLKIFYREAMPYEGWRKYRSIDVRFRGQVICS